MLLRLTSSVCLYLTTFLMCCWQTVLLSVSVLCPVGRLGAVVILGSAHLLQAIIGHQLFCWTSSHHMSNTSTPVIAYLSSVARWRSPYCSTSVDMTSYTVVTYLFHVTRTPTQTTELTVLVITLKSVMWRKKTDFIYYYYYLCSVLASLKM